MMSANDSEALYFERNPGKEVVLVGRVRGYRKVLESLATHKNWFSWDAFHKQVTEMVLCEMQLEDLDRLIVSDFESNAWMDKTRNNVAARLDRLRKNLGLTASHMMRVMKYMSERPSIENSLAAAIDDWKKFQ